MTQNTLKASQHSNAKRNVHRMSMLHFFKTLSEPGMAARGTMICFQPDLAELRPSQFSLQTASKDD